MLNDDDHDTQMEASEREQNNEEASEWEQNNEDVHSVSVSALDQNNENVCDGSQAQDQITKIYSEQNHIMEERPENK